MTPTKLLIGQILIVFAIVITGVWAATQWAAAMLAYQPELGRPWAIVGGLPVYRPWALFAWWYHFGAYAEPVFDRAGMLAGASGFVGCGAAIGGSLWRARQSNNVTTYGSARWANGREVETAGLHRDAGVLLGSLGSRYLRHDGPEHIMAFAPTRSGKGVGLVVPTLLSCTGSTVVHDIKGENWTLTAGWRSRFSHCLLFNPTDTRSARYNPLLEIRRGANEVRDVQNIADILVDPEGALERRNHWEKTSHSLLVGAILHACRVRLSDCHDHGRRHRSRAGRGQGPRGRADRQRPRLHRQARGHQRGRGVAVVIAWPCLCQCPHAAGPHAQPRAPDAAVVGLGGAGREPASRGAAAAPRTDRRDDAFPALDPCRRCRPHVGGRTDRCGQVGAAGADRHAVPPVCRIAGLHLRQGLLRPCRRAGDGRRASCAGAGSGTGDALAFQPLRHIDRADERSWAAEWIAALLAQEKVTVTPEVKDAIWSALGSLASAPVEERTLTGLALLLQSNGLRTALTAYTLDGPYGRLLDAAEQGLSFADVQCFETEALMGQAGVVAPVLTYLFHRLEERFDGRPTLLILDEAWIFLDHPLFAARIREWLKTLRKKNVAVLFATQSLADIADSSIAPAIIESCPQRILLPNDRAIEPQSRAAYERFGLNDRQIELIARATPKRHYYLQSTRGNRLFELGLGSIALALCGASDPGSQACIDALLAEHGAWRFARRFLAYVGLDWAAALLADFPQEPRLLEEE